jgi:lysophospholipase L1-like esterase
VSPGGGSATGGQSDRWVGTWSSAQQLTEDANEPPAPGLGNNTLRQIVHVSIGGTRLRVRFSNEYGSSPVTIQKAHCATSSGTHTISAATDASLRFAGSASVTIPAKQFVVSDPLDFSLSPLSNLAITIAFGTTSSDITGHPGSRTTSYLQAGDAVSAASLSSPVTADHWYILSGVEVQAAEPTAALVVLGDSISDGRGSTTNGNDRWPDGLAKRLRANAATSTVAVLNQSIGGNAVFSAGQIGPVAKVRFENDVLKQSGARWLIVFEGVNDVGTASDAQAAADTLIAAYQEFVSKAHTAGISVYGVPILPFNGHSYFTAQRETARKKVNDWIRAPMNFDGVIDLDAVVRDPQQTDRLLPMYDGGDHLHPNPAGYQKMADSVDLKLFSR